MGSMNPEVCLLGNECLFYGYETEMIKSAMDQSKEM